MAFRQIGEVSRPMISRLGIGKATAGTVAKPEIETGSSSDAALTQVARPGGNKRGFDEILAAHPEGITSEPPRGVEIVPAMRLGGGGRPAQLVLVSSICMGRVEPSRVAPRAARPIHMRLVWDADRHAAPRSMTL